jgi:hypothetical protein
MNDALLKMVPLSVPIIGLIFQAGKQSEKLDDLYARMDIQVAEQKSTREILYGIENKLTAIEQDIKHILVDIQKSKK